MGGKLTRRCLFSQCGVSEFSMFEALNRTFTTY